MCKSAGPNVTFSSITKSIVFEEQLVPRATYFRLPRLHKVGASERQNLFHEGAVAELSHPSALTHTRC